MTGIQDVVSFDEPDDSRYKHGASDGAWKALHVSRLTLEKGAKWILRAASLKAIFHIPATSPTGNRRESFFVTAWFR